MQDYRIRESGMLVPAGLTVQARERIAELEFATEDLEWLALGNLENAFEFSRQFNTSITRVARLTYLKNPIVQRGVKVKADYVFGRGVNIQAKDKDVNNVIQAFLNDPRNQTEFTSQIARLDKERELQTDGNIFFVLIPHMQTGKIRIRTINADEMTDIICNPDDRKESWYYKREYTESTFNFESGQYVTEKKIAFYRDWRYKPDVDRTSIGSSPVIDGQYIYHIKVGGFSDWKFGVSELYSAIDWTKAYKIFLENWSTIVAAYARFAYKVTTTGGKPGVQAATKRLSTTVSTSAGETNPKPTTASTFVAQEGTTIDPIRTSGATTSAEDGRRLLLMVCASFGLPETFFGDVSVGTLATAKSLDRPTELMISNRQTLWTDIYKDIIDFVMFYAVSAIDGPLRAFGEVTVNEYGESVVTFDDTIDTHIDIDFPSVVESDTKTSVEAINTGAAYIPDDRLLTRLVLGALGENDIDTLLEAMYNEDGTPKQPKPAAAPATNPLNLLADPNATADASGDPLAEAARQLRESVEALRASLYPSMTSRAGERNHSDRNHNERNHSEPELVIVDRDAFMRP